MDDPRGDAARTLATQDMGLLRLSGMILAALVERRVLSSTEARAIVADVADQMPLEMDAFRLALSQLEDLFPK